MPDLASRIAEVTRNDKLGQSETATRLWAVDPILEDLGWRLRDPDEVVPEYPVRGGIVDYCLRSNGRNLVLLEAKRAGSDLTGHQEQLLGYAFAEHAPLAALTDGIQWWLYLPRADGDWEQRRFFSLDLRSQEASQAAEHLERFLGKDSVVGGDAVDAAQAEFDSQERDRRVRAALEVAWQRVLGDSEGLLIDLVSDEVQREAGHRPARETVHQFVLGKMRQETTSPPANTASAAPNVVRRSAQDSRSSRADRPRRKAPGTSPTSFSLDGRSRPVNNWPDLLIAVCNLLIEETGDRFAERISGLRTKTRFTPTPEGTKPRQLANGMWLDVTLSANNSGSLARNVVRAVRGPQGADSFRIDTTG